MSTYKVTLTRAYLVTIESQNIDTAREQVEFYLGDCPDLSTEAHRQEERFSIKEIELALNEAYEAEEIRD